MSVWCYAKPGRAISRVSNYVRRNPGLQRGRPLWAGDKLTIPFLPEERKFILLSMTEVARKLSSNI